MRRVLDRFYLATALLAAAATILIAVVVFIQVGGRLLGYGIRGADDVVAWLTACASLSGIGYAFTQRAHVRVDLVMDRLTGRPRAALELVALGAALGLSAYAAYACILMVIDSYRMGEISQGDIPVRLWIPQLGVAVGAVALAVAVADALVHRLIARGSGSAKSAPLTAAEI